MRAYAQTYTVTVPDETAARSVADRLAARGHRLVAVRLKPSSSLRPELNGWWNVYSAFAEPPTDQPLAEPKAEIKAVSTIARLYGGVIANGYGRDPDGTMADFNRDGLVHELSQEESEKIRSGLGGAGTPSAPEPPPGLRCGPVGAERKAVRAVAAAITAATGPDTPSQYRLAATGWDSAGELLEVLMDGALHQGTPMPWTAAAAPILAAVASDDQVPDLYAAVATTVLLDMAVAGRRQMATQPFPATEDPDAAAARTAVEAVVPGLPADRSELTDFAVAALAAAVGMPPAEGLDRIAEQYPARRPAVALVRALAAGSTDLETAYTAVRTARPDLADTQENPDVPLAYRAADLLAHLVAWEVDNARPGSRRPWRR